MNNDRIPTVPPLRQLMPIELTNDEILFGLKLGNAIHYIVYSNPIPPFPEVPSAKY